MRSPGTSRASVCPESSIPSGIPPRAKACKASRSAPVEVARTASRTLSRLREALAVKQMSAREADGASSARAMRPARARSMVPVRDERTKRSGVPSGRWREFTGSSGACMMTAWALDPPMPKELIPAARGLSASFQSARAVLM